VIDVRLKAARACEWAWCVATTARAPWVACRAYQAYGVRAAGSRQPPSRCVSASHYAHSAPALIYSLGACTPHHHLLTGSTHWLNSLAHSLPLYPLGSCTPHQTASHYTHLVPAFLITIYSLAQLTGSQPPTILTWLLHSSSDSLPLYSLGSCTPHQTASHYTHLAPALLIRQPPTIPTGSCTPHQTASHYTHWLLHSSSDSLPLCSLGSCTHLLTWILHSFITIYSLAQLTGSTHWLTASHSPLAPALLHHHSAIRAAGAQVRIVNTTIQ